MGCKHNLLKAMDIPIGFEVSYEFTKEYGGVTDMWQWRKFRCVDCGAIVTILNAVVEDKNLIKGDTNE
jgi:hypothetical protein